MVVSRSVLMKVGAVAVVLIVVGGGAVGYVGYQYQQNPPSVESVESEWGTVTDDQTEVETSVVVENPNSPGIPGILDLRYTTTLNGVVLMEGEQASVGIDQGRNEISIPATMNNTAIAEWWVRHVNDGETSELAVTAEVSGPGGVGQEIPVRSDTVETNMLDSLQTSGARTITLQGEEFVVLKEQSAAWGEASMEETPLEFSATIENRHDYALTLDGLGYVVEMNDVTVGEGQETDGVTIEPGESGTIDVSAAIDTRKMADWWATHVRNGESTRMNVAMYGLVERDGELERVPFELFSQELEFTTNMLQGGGTNIRQVQDADEGPPAYERPTIVDQSREWGEVTEETSQLRGSVTLDNPNEGDVNDFVEISTSTYAEINGVTVADETEDIGTLEPGRSTETVTVPWDNTATSEWWVRHVNDGEQSTRTIQQTTLADLGFTKFEVMSSSGEGNFTTDMLAGIETEETVDVTTEDGQKIAELRKTEASWGEADAQTSPITVSVTIKNTFDTQITLEDLQYTFMMNDVAVGEGTAPESHTIAPGETRTIEYTLTLDSQKMDAWWASHIRNGEETTLDVQTSVRVVTPLGSDRAEVGALTQTQNVTTDFLSQDGG